MSNLKTVLCVDDTEEVLVFLRACLRDAGYQVLTATSASGAYAVALESKPDLVITDLVMPDEDGYALCRNLRANQRTAALPILVFTVVDDEPAVLDAGATAFLGKPVDETELLKGVAALVGRAATREGLLLATSHIRAGRLDDAMRELDRIIMNEAEQREIGLWAAYLRGQVCELRGQLDHARTTYTRTANRHPSFWRSHSRLGRILEQQGANDEAAEEYRASLTIKPGQLDIERRLARLPRAG